MAKIDHSYLRKAAQGILDHLGTEEEGENPDITDSEDRSMSNVSDNTKSLKDTAAFKMGAVSNNSADGKKFAVGSDKKRKDAALALLASNLASKFNK